MTSEEFLNNFIEAIILEGSNGESYKYFTSLDPDTKEYISSLVNQKKEELESIDVNDDAYKNGLNEALKDIPYSDSKVYNYAVRKFKLEWLKNNNQNLSR